MALPIEFQGCRFFYEIQGQGEPIVFIQGAGLHGAGWVPQTSVLKSLFRCLTFDNRGIGQSQPVGLPLTVSQMAADALAIMDAAQIPAAHIVGHSLGGCIAQQIAFDAPARVKSLSLLCTSGKGSDATKISWKMLRLGIRSRVGTRRMRRRAFLEMVMSPGYLATHEPAAIAEALKPIFGHDLADTPPIVMKQLRALSGFDAGNRLRRLDIPTLVISSALDPIFSPQCGRVLAEKIPAARFIEIGDVSHGVTLERADLINSLLVEHIKLTGARL